MFIDENKLTPEATKHLQINISPNHQNSGLEIELRPYKMMKEFLKWLISQQQGKIWVSIQCSVLLLNYIHDYHR